MVDKRALVLAGFGALATSTVLAYKFRVQSSNLRVAANRPQMLRAAQVELTPSVPESNLHEVVETWDNPQVIANVPAGTNNGQLIVAQYTHGGTGYMTLLGTLWVPAGSDGMSFYYELRVDGKLVDRIFRVVGAGSSVSQTTGIPSPSRYEPPLVFHRKLELSCFNLDTVDHTAEVYVGGYTRRLVTRY